MVSVQMAPIGQHLVRVGEPWQGSAGRQHHQSRHEKCNFSFQFKNFSDILLDLNFVLTKLADFCTFVIMAREKMVHYIYHSYIHLLFSSYIYHMFPRSFSMSTESCTSLI